jgi:dienelactone hydrolase
MQTLGEDHVLLDQGEADRYAQWFFDALNPVTHLEAYERDVAIAFLCGAADLHVLAEAAARFRTALCDRDPCAADRVRVELYPPGASHQLSDVHGRYQASNHRDVDAVLRNARRR